MKFSTYIPVSDPNKKAHPQCEFQKHQNYSSLQTREASKSNPERHEFREHQNYLPLRTRESSKSNPERQEFQENALIDPCKNAHK